MIRSILSLLGDLKDMTPALSRVLLKVVLTSALFFLPLAAGVVRAFADLQNLGVVYLHGKASWPGALNGGILSALEDEGALIAEPEMPWSFNRRYGATYEQAMGEIEAAVAGLKAKGATRIVIIGHSLGANAAIGYAARHPDLAGVVAIAPGHLPDQDNMRSFVADAVERAKKLIAAGQGNVPQTFPDMAQGIPLSATATPTVYLSMFDPDGPAVIPKNAAIIGASPRPVPLLWVVGKLDPIDRRGPDYAFTRRQEPEEQICRSLCRSSDDAAGRPQASGRVDQFTVISA